MPEQTTEMLIKMALDFWPVLKELQLDQIEPGDPIWSNLADYDSALPNIVKDRTKALMDAIENYKVVHQHDA